MMLSNISGPTRESIDNLPIASGKILYPSGVKREGRGRGKKRREEKRIQRVALLAELVKEQVSQVSNARLLVLKAQRHFTDLSFHTATNH